MLLNMMKNMEEIQWKYNGQQIKETGTAYDKASVKAYRLYPFIELNQINYNGKKNIVNGNVIINNIHWIYAKWFNKNE